MAYFQNYCVQKSFLCCDIVSRLREDASTLCADSKILIRMQAVHETLLPQLETLYAEFTSKLKSATSSLSNVDSNEKCRVSEFIQLIELTWKIIRDITEKKSKSVRFMSSRGITIASYLEKLMILTDFVQKYYYADFSHSECALLFTHLYKQLRLLLAPELMKGDQLEGVLAYIHGVIPSIISLLTTIDMFLSTPRYQKISEFCREVIYGEMGMVQSSELTESPLKYLSQMLTGELFGYEPLQDVSPICETRSERFCENAKELALYIIGMSNPLESPYSKENVCLFPRISCLDPSFYECLPPLMKKTIINQKRTTHRGRGRPRRPSRFIRETYNGASPSGTEYLASDLGPIRIPSLHIPIIPFR